MTEKVSASDEVIVRKYARDQWIVMATLSSLIGGAFFVFQFLPLAGLNWGLESQIGLYIVIIILELCLVSEWYNSRTSSFWGKAFDSAIEHVVSNNSHFSLEDIYQRTSLLRSASILSVICFMFGLFFHETHHWLSLFVPIFSSVLGSGSIDEVVNKSTWKSKLMFIPVSLVFAFVFGMSWRFTDSNLPEALKYILTYGAWVSNGILGACIMHFMQYLIRPKHIRTSS